MRGIFDASKGSLGWCMRKVSMACKVPIALGIGFCVTGLFYLLWNSICVAMLINGKWDEDSPNRYKLTIPPGQKVKSAGNDEKNNDLSDCIFMLRQYKTETKDAKQHLINVYEKNNFLNLSGIGRGRNGEVGLEIDANNASALSHATYIFGRLGHDGAAFWPMFVVEAKVICIEKKTISVVLDLAVVPECITKEAAEAQSPYRLRIQDGKSDKFAFHEIIPYDGAQVKRIAWFEYKGMSPTQEILSIKEPSHDDGVFLPHLFFLCMSQPTSAPSLVSWLKSNWVFQSKSYGGFFSSDSQRASATVPSSNTKINHSATSTTQNTASNVPRSLKDVPSEKIKLSPSQIENIVCPELERALQEDWGKIANRTPVILIRLLNGQIQFFTMWFFASGMILIFFSWLERKYESTMLSRIKKEACELDKKSYDQFVSFVKSSISNQYFAESGVLKILDKFIANLRKHYDHRDFTSFFDSEMNAWGRRLENKRMYWQFFIGSLAGLGFLGTVWGIGEALMGTSNVLSDELTKQQSGVSGVALSLGTAFDTTLVSLFLSILASFVITWFIYCEKQFLFRVEEYLSDIIDNVGVFRPPTSSTAVNVQHTLSSDAAMATAQPDSARRFDSPGIGDEIQSTGHRDAAIIEQCLEIQDAPYRPNYLNGIIAAVLLISMLALLLLFYRNGMF